MSDNTFSSMGPIFTRVYANKLLDAVPEENIIQKMLSFDEAKRIGSSFHMPVQLTNENNPTFNVDGTAFTIGDGAAAVYGDATVQAASIVQPTNISFMALSRARGGVKQFIQGTSHFVEANVKGHAKTLEMSLLYGQSSIAACSAVTASGTTGTFTITAASWAPGFWKGCVGMNVDIYETMSEAAPENTNAAVVVTSVAETTRVVSFTCASGDAAALDALTTAFVFRRGEKTGASTYATCLGLAGMAQATSGTVFGINVGTYETWRASQKDVAGALTFDKFQDGLVPAFNAGVKKKLVAIVPPRAWSDLMTEQAALRKYDASYGSAKFDNGAGKLVFYSICGEVEIVAHPYLKEGEAYVFPKDEMKLIGSQNISFKIPGTDEDNMFILPTQAGIRLQTWSDMSIFPMRLSSLVAYTGITYS